MNHEPVGTTSNGVVCIFCSTRTPLSPSSHNQTSGNGFAARTGLLSLVRCQCCGKEAQYRAMEIIPMQSATRYGASA